MRRKNYENPAVCTACGGRCCKRYPGAAFPEDFKPDVLAGVQAALETGSWAIDWWEGDPCEGKNELTQAFFVRPAVQGCKKVFDPTWGDPCTFLGDKGCALPAGERPRGCRMLEPVATVSELALGKCKIHGLPDPKREAAVAWLPYNEQLEEVGCRVSEASRQKGAPPCPKPQL